MTSRQDIRAGGVALGDRLYDTAMGDVRRLVAAGSTLALALLAEFVGREGFASAVALAATPLPLVVHVLASAGARRHGAGYWILLAFGIINLTVNPILVAWFGSNLDGLPAEPSSGALSRVAVLSCVAFVSGIFGYYLTPAIRGGERRSIEASRRTITMFLALGLTGSVLKIGRFGGVSAYLSGSFVLTESGVGGTWAGLLSTILPPFWLVGCVLLWERYPSFFSGIYRLLLFMAAVAPMALYSYNRAAVVIPVCCLILASTRAPTKRLRRGRAGVWMIGLALVTWVWGEWRRVFLATAGGVRSLDRVGMTGEGRNSWDVWQVYTASQPRTAVILEMMEAQPPTLWNSILSAVPRFGEAWRPGSGPTVFNQALYGPGGSADQILPAIVEAHVALPWVAPVVLFFGVGGILRRLEPRASSSLSDVYFGWYVSIWIASVYFFSISVVLQIVVFFFWPLVVIWGVRRLEGTSAKRAIDRTSIRRRG